MSDSWQMSKNEPKPKPSASRPRRRTGAQHHFAPALPTIQETPAPATLAAAAPAMAGRAAATRAPLNAVPTPHTAAAAASGGPTSSSSPAVIRAFFAAYRAATAFRVPGGAAPPPPPRPPAFAAPVAPVAPARPTAVRRLHPDTVKANLAFAALTGKPTGASTSRGGACSVAELVAATRQARDERGAARASRWPGLVSGSCGAASGSSAAASATATFGAPGAWSAGCQR